MPEDNVKVPDILDLINQEKERAEKEESLKGGSGGGDFTYAEPLNIKCKSPKDFSVVRLVGKFKVINRCTIIADGDKRFYPNIPSSADGSEHIIWKAIKLLGQKDWDKKYTTDDGKQQAPFVYEETNPDIFKMVQHNNKEPFFHNGQSIPDRGWYPSTLLLQNAIDRKQTVEFSKDDKKKEHPLGEFNYCQKEKKTKLLSKDGFMSGIANSSFQGEFNTMLQKFAPIEENKRIAVDPNFFDAIGYDVVITKGSQKFVPYSLNRSDDRIADHTPFIVEGSLTEEELKYEMYDVDVLGKLTTNLTIFKRLGKKLKTIFYALNKSDVYDNWVANEVESERIENAKKKAEAKANDSSDSDEKVKVEETKVEVAVDSTPTREAVVKSRKVEVTLTKEDETCLDDLIRSTFPKMLPKDYTHVLDIKDGAIVWKNTKDMYACSNEANCKMITPSEVSACPSCGTIFIP